MAGDRGDMRKSDRREVRKTRRLLGQEAEELVDSSIECAWEGM